ncbi:MAG: hypothetical protein IPM51_10730 [Sphingobacteriaceae bacterium]|nr:hypothetical protein [Sphingobacteriaceae bacterium]
MQKRHVYRQLILIFSFLLTNLTFGQTTSFKVVKESTKPRLTIAKTDTGLVTLEQIISDNKLTIQNGTDNIKIRCYDAAVTNGGEPKIFFGKKSTLTKKIVSELKRNNNTNLVTLTIFNVVAFNDSKETIRLNDIRITVLK